MGPEINYNFLSQALNFYSHSFERIEVPWMVPEEYTTMTHIRDGEFVTGFGDLVGSAEQSFLCLYDNGKIDNGPYCTITPCFRNDTEDELHQKTFMKVELIHFLQQGEYGADILTSFMYKCLYLFELCGCKNLKVEETEYGCFDITNNDIEIGSYGIRNIKGINWVFGTGIAEPRLSTSKLHDNDV